MEKRFHERCHKKQISLKSDNSLKHKNDSFLYSSFVNHAYS